MDKTMDLNDVCNLFSYAGDYVKSIPYGDGHINDTYKVTYNNNGVQINYILQKINHDIFSDVEGLMFNIERVTEYLNKMILVEELPQGYEVLTLIKTLDSKSFLIDKNGNYWRSYVFIEGATGYTYATNPEMLYEAGKSFGKFQSLLSDFPAATLYETIEGFHNTKKRYETFLKCAEADLYGRKSRCENEIEFVNDRSGLCNIFVDALEVGDLPLRVTHNDTKINNVLLDDITGMGRCVIDLDTVMPGSALFDYGDAIRSCGSTAAEDSEDLENLKVDFDRFEAYTKGFLESVGSTLTNREFEMLHLSAIIMTFECGMRFLTDFLNGDKYFKVHKDEHNLIRARNQFKFVKEMEENSEKLIGIINKYRERI